MELTFRIVAQDLALDRHLCRLSRTRRRTHTGGVQRVCCTTNARMPQSLFRRGADRKLSFDDYDFD